MEDGLVATIVPLLALPLAFLVGFALRRGSVCMVDGVHQAIVRGRTLRLRAFAVAAGTAGAVILPLAWLFPEACRLAPAFPLGWLTLLGALLLGLGARINGACQFGTLGRLAGGELDFLVTALAAVAGAMVAVCSTAPVAPGQSPLTQPGLVGGLVLAIFVVLAAPALRLRYWRNFARALRHRKAHISPFSAMLIVGAAGGVLYTLAGSWTFGSLLNREGAILVGLSANHGEGRAIAGTLAMLAGAIYAAVWTRQFRLRPPTLTALRTNAPGGLLMGAGAALIPGGNGTMLLYAMPSASPSAWAAFAAMTLVIALTFIPQRFAHKARRR